MFDEQNLIKRAKSGDRSAFNELIELYQNQVVGFAYNLLGNREDALDAGQEVFIRVYKSLASFRGDSSFSTWIYSITKNICTDHLRKRHDSVSLDSKEGEPAINIADTKNRPEQEVEKTETQKAVRAAISALDENQRTVVTLFDIDGLSYDEIAEITDTPIGTVKSRLSRARENLRKHFLKNREHFS